MSKSKKAVNTTTKAAKKADASKKAAVKVVEAKALDKRFKKGAIVYHTGGLGPVKFYEPPKDGSEYAVVRTHAGTEARVLASQLRLATGAEVKTYTKRVREHRKLEKASELRRITRKGAIVFHAAMGPVKMVGPAPHDGQFIVRLPRGEESPVLYSNLRLATPSEVKEYSKKVDERKKAAAQDATKKFAFPTSASVEAAKAEESAKVEQPTEARLNGFIIHVGDTVLGDVEGTLAAIVVSILPNRNLVVREEGSDANQIWTEGSVHGVRPAAWDRDPSVLGQKFKELKIKFEEVGLFAPFTHKGVHHVKVSKSNAIRAVIEGTPVAPRAVLATDDAPMKGSHVVRFRKSDKVTRF